MDLLDGNGRGTGKVQSLQSLRSSLVLVERLLIEIPHLMLKGKLCKAPPDSGLEKVEGGFEMEGSQSAE